MGRRRPLARDGPVARYAPGHGTGQTGGLQGTLSPFEAISLAKQHGFDALELGIADAGSAFGIDATQAQCEDLVAAARKEGVALLSTASGLYWGRALGDDDPAKSAQARKDLEAMIQIASWLGAKTHLTIPGAVEVFFLPERPIQDYQGVWDRATEGLRAVLPLAQEKGVRLGIENVWNKFLLSPLEFAAYIDEFDSPWVQAYFDVGNVVLFGYPEDWIRTLNKRIHKVQVKDFKREGYVWNSLPYEGDVNWPEVRKALQEIGYTGYITEEFPRGDVAWLKELARRMVLSGKGAASA